MPKNIRATILLFIEDEDLKTKITDACEQIDVFCVENISEENLLGIDAVLLDSEPKDDFSSVCQKNLLIPILPEQSENFSEFNPMKFE